MPVILRSLAVALWITALASTGLADPVTLREAEKEGMTSNVQFTLKVTGKLLIPDAKNKAKTLKMEAQSDLDFEERLVGSGSGKLQSLRYYKKAQVKSKVESRETVKRLRDQVRLVVAERRDRPFLFSPTGPLTTTELELIDVQHDSLAVAGILPDKPVEIGDSWELDDKVVGALFKLTEVTSNTLKARLSNVRDQSARIVLSGIIKGTADGARTSLNIAGVLDFDRQESRVVQFAVNQNENRMPGPHRPGMNLAAEFKWVRTFDAAIKHVPEKSPAGEALTANAATELLLYQQPESHYQLYHSRDWKLMRDDPAQAVLRFVEDGQHLAQCNILSAPTVAAGNHMKPSEFRSQVQDALGSQFRRFIQEGEIKADDGNWIYRVAAVGNGKTPNVWYYYIAASPEGRQLFFIFTLDGRNMERFGQHDMSLIGSLDFSKVQTVSKN